MTADRARDVMLVCENGHVITDLLVTNPERQLTHCDRCGAATLARCHTCGSPLPGAIPVPGLMPVGERRPPQHCPTCGAAFPWTARPSQAWQAAPLAVLENLLRRLPRVARQLRWRHAERPAFRVEDVYDLEDLLRALLPLHFDDVRPEARTPRYDLGTRTDFVLAPEETVLTCKCVAAEPQLVVQLDEDMAYYHGREIVRTLVAFVYDPEQRLIEPRRQEAAWSKAEGDLAVRCVIGW
jgi:hypothetical protein